MRAEKLLTQQYAERSVEIKVKKIGIRSDFDLKKYFLANANIFQAPFCIDGEVFSYSSNPNEVPVKHSLYYLACSFSEFTCDNPQFSGDAVRLRKPGGDNRGVFNFVPFYIECTNEKLPYVLSGLRKYSFLVYQHNWDVAPWRDPTGRRKRRVVIWIHSIFLDAFEFDIMGKRFRDDLLKKYGVAPRMYSLDEFVPLPHASISNSLRGFDLHYNSGRAVHPDDDFIDLPPIDSEDMQQVLSRIDLRDWWFEEVGSALNPIQKKQFIESIVEVPGPSFDQMVSEITKIKASFYGGSSDPDMSALRLLLLVKFSSRDKIASALDVSTAGITRYLDLKKNGTPELVDRISKALEADLVHVEELRVLNAYNAFLKQDHLKKYYQAISKLEFSLPPSKQPDIDQLW